jgi:hypothetical protein
MSYEPSANDKIKNQKKTKKIVPPYIGAKVHELSENGTPTTRGFLN